MPQLLLELLSEEIPARMQSQAANDLRNLVTAGMKAAGLESGEANAFATPRRLCLVVEDVPFRSRDKTLERRGPRAGAPSRALEGFSRSAGVTIDELELRSTANGDYYFASIAVPGRESAELLGEIIPNSIAQFPWPKSMRWGSGELRWVRPLESILCILTHESRCETVEFVFGGLRSSNLTSGHRFMAPGAFEVHSFANYRQALAERFVLLNAEERKARISAELGRLEETNGLATLADAELLDEVAGLVEWPVVKLGRVGESFHHLPSEILQTSMKSHQKYFSLTGNGESGITNFAVVANLEACDGGKTLIRGNEIVLDARLADARFFWENDLRRIDERGLERFVQQLHTMGFHRRLGTIGDRVKRIESLSKCLAAACSVEPGAALQAARLAKADLVSEMVTEFPELQGIMGKYFALHAGLGSEVAAACEGHYAPRGLQDSVPADGLSAAVALADRIDMLVGFFGIGEQPSGSKDPLGLRRATLGIIRILTENRIRVHLIHVIQSAIESYAEQFEGREFSDRFNIEKTAGSVLGFIHDRFAVYLQSRRVRQDVVTACFSATASDDLVLLMERAMALNAFVQTGEGGELMSGYKRVNNIIRQDEAGKSNAGRSVTEELLVESAEKELASTLATAKHRLKLLESRNEYQAAMAELAKLSGPVNRFFDEVLVNCADSRLRQNRYALLTSIRDTCTLVADLSRIRS